VKPEQMLIRCVMQVVSVYLC